MLRTIGNIYDISVSNSPMQASYGATATNHAWSLSSTL